MWKIYSVLFHSFKLPFLKMPLYGHTQCFVVKGKKFVVRPYFRKFLKNSCFHVKFILLPPDPKNSHSRLYLVICHWNHNMFMKSRLTLSLEACQHLQTFYNQSFNQVIHPPNQKKLIIYTISGLQIFCLPWWNPNETTVFLTLVIADSNYLIK